MYFIFRQTDDGKVITKQIGSLSEAVDDSIELNEELSLRVIQGFKEGRIVTLKNNEITLGSVEMFYGIPRSEPKKVKILENSLSYLAQRTRLLDMVDFVIYTETNNKLNSKGYFITEENREEQYLAILETGNEELIDLLEEFLIAKDLISPLIDAKKRHHKIFEKLQQLDEDSEEVDALLKA